MYRMHLDKEHFENVKAGNKTVEIRLNDKKRREFKVGDKIEFENRADKAKLEVTITELNIYTSFEELYKHEDKLAMGYKEDEVACPDDMSIYYSEEDQIKNGVVAIHFTLNN